MEDVLVFAQLIVSGFVAAPGTVVVRGPYVRSAILTVLLCWRWVLPASISRPGASAPHAHGCCQHCRADIVKKCIDAALSPLRTRGIRIFNYLDDWLVCAPSRELAYQHTSTILAYLASLGLHLNVEKSNLVPARSVEYLGLVLNSITMKTCLTPKWMFAIRECIRSCLARWMHCGSSVV